MVKRFTKGIYFSFIFIFFVCFRYFLILCSDDFFGQGIRDNIFCIIFLLVTPHLAEVAMVDIWAVFLKFIQLGI